MAKAYKYLLVFLLASVILIFTASFSFTDSDLHLVFCNVGQGDAILIYKGSSQILIDGGPDNQVLTCLSNHMPFWDRKIEAIALTHPDADHYTGLIEVVRRYQIESFLWSGVWKQGEGPQTLLNELDQKHIEKILVKTGSKIKLGDIKLNSLWPTKEYLAGVSRIFTSSQPINQYSLVFDLSFGNFDALLTGDIQPPATDLLAKEIKSVADTQAFEVPKVLSEVEVLKVPHHGSKNGLTEKLLDTVNPKLAVISVGAKNRYGHPSKEVIGMLGSRDIRTLRTDQNGEIEIATDGFAIRTPK